MRSSLLHALLAAGILPAVPATTSAPVAAERSAPGLVGYLVACALPAGESITRGVGEAARTYEGELGLAPAWATRALDPAERRLLSACVLARVNRDGRHVSIAMERVARDRVEQRLAASSSTVRLEGAFFGDLFAQPPRLYACAGSVDDATTRWLESHDRLCTLAQDAASTRTQCGFELVGPCSRSSFVRPEADYVDEAFFVHLPALPGARP